MTICILFEGVCCLALRASSGKHARLVWLGGPSVRDSVSADEIQIDSFLQRNAPPGGRNQWFKMHTCLADRLASKQARRRASGRREWRCESDSASQISTACAKKRRACEVRCDHRISGISRNFSDRRTLWRTAIATKVKRTRL